MIDKKQMIGELVKALEKDNLEIRQVSIDNESRDFVFDGELVQRHALTGYRTITIQIFDKEIYSDFVKKLNGNE